MAIRKPLVRYDDTGRTEELRSGDTLPGAGGAAAISVANVTIVPAQFTQAVVTVIDANVSLATSVMPTLAPNADWDADDLAEFEVTAQASTGSIDFCIARLGPIVGDFKIIYQLG